MTTPYRVQFLDASSTVIREYHADARSVAAAMGLMEGLPWPQDAVRLRLLDADGREVHTLPRASREAGRHGPHE